MMTREQAHKLAEQILSFSRFPECSVRVNESEEAYIRFANNGVTTSGFVTSQQIDIQSTKEGKTGSISLTDTSADALQQAVARSEELAALSPVNPEHMPPPAPQEFPDTGSLVEETANARGAQMAPQIKAIIDAAVKQKLQAAGFFTRSAGASAIANKGGLFGFTRAADARLSTTIRKPDGSSSGWAAKPSVKIGDIHGAELAERAIAKCLAWKNPRRLEPGSYTVVLEPTATGDLFSGIYGAFDARSAEEGRSFFAKKGGGTLASEKLFPEFITLRTDPNHPDLPADPWTGEWLPAKPVTWIEKGVVKNLEYGRYWASRTKQQPTPDADNLVLEGGNASLEDLIRSVDRGLLVTHFWYIRVVNPQTRQLTGLTRDGLFLIENGKVTEPVTNFRFNESPFRMLQNAKLLGRAERMRSLEGNSMIAPPVVAANFHFSSVSDAV
jgi:predicted Zn-dependent protease